MAHSPGEWQIRRDFGPRVDIVSYHNGWSSPVASLVEARFVMNGDVALHVDEVEANALLLCAAPKLLAALEALLAAAGDFLQDEAGLKATQMAELAIKKAKHS